MKASELRKVRRGDESKLVDDYLCKQTCGNLKHLENIQVIYRSGNNAIVKLAAVDYVQVNDILILTCLLN